MELVFRWWLACFVIGVLALPLTTWLFRRLPGAGLAWSKPLGLLVTGYLSWLLAMLGFASFGAVAVILSLFALGAVGWFVWRPHWQLQTIKQLVQRYWLSWLAYEVLFVVLLLAGLWLRANGSYGSGIQHTEKPMELMLLNSVLTSPEFPPRDLWFAGYSINYYYLGYVLVGVLASLSFVSVGVAFNLGLASILALAGVGVAGFVATLVALVQQPHQRRIHWGQVAAALLAVVLVFWTGNQLGALNRIAGTPLMNQLTDSQKISVLMQAFSGEPRQVNPAEIKGNEIKSALLPPMNGFDWWAPSRAIYDDTGPLTTTIDGQEYQTVGQYQIITEFPYFSFFLGDMHPHVLALPWAILALALALAFAMRSDLPAWLNTSQGRIELLLSALIIGSLYAINSWDAPTYGLIFAGSLGLLYQRLETGGPRQWWRGYFKHMALLVGTALVLFAPFLLTFTSFAGRDDIPEPFDLPIIRTIGRIIAPARDHTSVGDLLIIFGLFLIPLSFWWASRFRGRAWKIPAMVTLATFVVGLLIGVPLLIFGPITYWLIRLALGNSEEPALAFMLWLSAIAAALLLFTDLFYLRDHFEQRLNTIFKFFYQIWLIWGMLAAWSVWRLLSEGRWRRRWNSVWVPLFLLFFAGALVYPITTFDAELMGRVGRTANLDGTLNSAYSVEPARMLADWLKLNADEDAVLVGAAGGSYGSGGEVAALSGRSTLLAWSGSHQSLWRSKQPLARDQVGLRGNAINRIYTSTDQQEVLRHLADYGVDYIIWGPNEQQISPEATTQVINQIATIVYESGGWTLYQVNAALPSDSSVDPNAPND